MGTFRHVTVSSLDDSGRNRTLRLLVDTGATYLTLPLDLIEGLGIDQAGTRRVRLADGREEDWMVAHVLVRIDGREGPTVCLIGPRGGAALLGAVVLETLGLGVDPVSKRLVPVVSFV